MSLLLKNHGSNFEGYFIPPFLLREGELVVLNLQNRADSFGLQNWLVDIVTGKTAHKRVSVYLPLTYVAHFKQSWFHRHFNRMSVEKYLKKHADPTSEYIDKIYDYKGLFDPVGFINAHTKIDTLAGTPRKLLSLYTTLSRHSYIVYDLLGVDPAGAELIQAVVKQHINEGGAALLLDRHSELRNDCSRYLEAEW